MRSGSCSLELDCKNWSPKTVYELPFLSILIINAQTPRQLVAYKRNSAYIYGDLSYAEERNVASRVQIKI